MGSAEHEEVHREAWGGAWLFWSQPGSLNPAPWPKALWMKGPFCSVLSTSCTFSHHHTGCPNLIGEKMDGTEKINPLAPLSIPALDVDLWSGDRPAVWAPVLSEPGPESLTRAGALTPAWLGRKGRAIEEFHLASIPRMQLLICPSPEVEEMGTARRQLCVHCP